MKIAAIIKAIEEEQHSGEKISYRLIHTGQHYDRNMSGSFFEQLGIPEPHVNLGAGGGTQAEQTSAIMLGYEKLLMDEPCDVCLVVGDVTSTMACAITAQKMQVKVAHVEAGIRSGDWTMPEEINRLVTDSITNYFFTTTDIANNNLRGGGIPESAIYFVGNTMIDTLLANRHRFRKPGIWDEAGLKDQNYIVLTLHRPANVDEQNQLKSLMREIIRCSNNLPVIFPVHPRTQKTLKEIGVDAPNLFMVEPMSYLEFNYLVERAKAVITDSGGITEETTVMSVPCMTLRTTTERPETITVGTNELLGTDPESVAPAMKKLFDGQWKKGAIPELWDGKTGKRIVDHLINISKNNFKA